METCPGGKNVPMLLSPLKCFLESK